MPQMIFLSKVIFIKACNAEHLWKESPFLVLSTKTFSISKSSRSALTFLCNMSFVCLFVCSVFVTEDYDTIHPCVRFMTSYYYNLFSQV